MRRRLTRHVVLGLLAGAFVLLTAWWQSPGMRNWLKLPREATTSSPSLSPLVSRNVVLLRRGHEACLEPVTFYGDTGRARIRLRAPKAPVPRVELEFTGPGFTATGRLPHLDPQAEGTVEVPMTPEAGHDVTGRFCWHNRGPTPIQLIGTNEGRSLTPAELTVDGVHQEHAELELILFEARNKPLQQRKTELVDRGAALTAGFIPTWLLWPIAALFLGLPLVVAVLFGLSVWRGERR